MSGAEAAAAGVVERWERQFASRKAGSTQAAPEARARPRGSFLDPAGVRGPARPEPPAGPGARGGSMTGMPSRIG